MTGAWYIDALDARAGMAFASHRRADLAAVEQALDEPAVQIVPPDFMPRTVTSRSVGLGASRGTFQLGLFVGEGEIGFPTLEAVIAFVRRAYVASGGGDGAAGGGVPPSPPDGPDEPGGGEPEAADEDGRPFERAHEQMAGLFRAAKEASAGLQLVPGDHGRDLVSAFEAETGQPEYKQLAIDTGAARLAAQGLLEIGAELIRRCPDERASPGAINTWWMAKLSLSSAANRLALWPLAADGPFPVSLTGAARWFLARRQRFLMEDDMVRQMAAFGEPPSGKRLAALGFYLLCLSNCGMDLRWLLHDEDPRHTLRYQDLMPRDEASDRFDDLAQWPLPSAIREALGLTLATSVADFLSLTSGSAPSFSGMSSAEHGILLFASAHLTATRNQTWAGRWDTRIVEALHSSTFADAAAWLKSQMPEAVFPTKVEEAILSAAKCSYA